MLKTLRYIFMTELLLLWRNAQEWLYPLCFFMLIIVMFPLAFSPDRLFLQTYIPGGIWLAALLASLLAVENVFLTDLEDQHLETLALSEIPLAFILSAKLSAQWLVTQLPLIVMMPLLGLWFQLSPTTTMALSISLLLGTPVLTLLGSMSVALTLGLRQPGILLGLLFLPLVTPILIFGTTIVQQSQAGLSILGPLAFLAGMMVLALTVLPFTIAVILRVGMDD